MNKYMCNKCNKNFPNNYKLNRHLNRKTDCLKKIIHYNDDLLKTIVIRDKCIIENIPKNIKSETEITFICKCGKINNKKFRNIYLTFAICEICCKNNKIIKTKQTSLEKYGTEHYSKTQEMKDKTKQTSLEKYGKEHYNQTQKGKDRYKNTCLKKYGVDNISQAQEIKQKKEDKSMENYGTKNISQAQEIKQKKEDKSMENYGTKCVLQSQEIKDKSKQTCLIKYGTEYPLQNAEYAEKAAKNVRNWKNFTFPCGSIVKYQGYENFAYDELLKQGFDINDIVTSKTKVPIIWYINNEKKHRYYVDIYIPTINKMIEVKSTWTYAKKKEDNIIPKALQCIKEGYDYEIWIYDNKRNKIVISEF
jgi:hypothetical protein